MSGSYVVPVHVTPEEWELLDQVASGRRITIEDLLRERLGFGPVAGEPPPPPRHLRLVRSDPAA